MYLLILSSEIWFFINFYLIQVWNGIFNRIDKNRPRELSLVGKES